MLTIFVEDVLFELFTDATSVGLGAILTQGGGNYVVYIMDFKFRAEI